MNNYSHSVTDFPQTQGKSKIVRYLHKGDFLKTTPNFLT